MKAENLHKLASILGLLIAVVSAFQLDHGILVFGSQAEFQAHERVENYKTLMLALGSVTFLIWPVHALLTAIRAQRDAKSELSFWRRVALTQAVLLVGVVVALGWTVVQRLGTWH